MNNKLNVELLQQVAQAILANPDHFDMGDWLRGDLSCGTIGCIAGWTCAITNQWDMTSPDTWERNIGAAIQTPAQVLLGLSKSCANKLFFTADWPEQFRLAYSFADGAAGRAQVTYNRIQHFINHGE